MIGQWDQRVSLQAPARTGDGGGGASESWNAFATVWASIVPERGEESFGPDREESRTRYRVNLRRRADVTAGQRVVTPWLTLSIVNVLDAGPRTAAMTLLCETLPDGAAP
jgi:SPP1 family predicted phage head-tail adaptor